MDTKYKIIKDAFEREGLNRKTVVYSITQYSLNTPLSFKFDNSRDLYYFLDADAGEEGQTREKINKMIVEAGVDPESFFFVNFYKPNVAEL